MLAFLTLLFFMTGLITVVWITLMTFAIGVINKITHAMIDKDKGVTEM